MQHASSLVVIFMSSHNRPPPPPRELRRLVVELRNKIEKNNSFASEVFVHVSCCVTFALNFHPANRTLRLKEIVEIQPKRRPIIILCKYLQMKTIKWKTPNAVCFRNKTLAKSKSDIFYVCYHTSVNCCLTSFIGKYLLQVPV